jgi:chlorobactene glucosyltransferase
LQAALRDGLDLLSLIPHLEGCGFWERLMQPSVAALIALFNRPGRVNDPSRPEVFANGQYILVRRQAYQVAGGHAAVAGKVLEDVELARVLVHAGSRLRLALGRELFSTRMYHNLSSLVNGWTKNFYMILRSRLHRVLAAGTTALLLSLWPAVFGLGSAAALISGWRPWPVAWLWSAVAVYAMVLVFQTVLRALNRWYPAYAPLAPLANLLAVFILLRSSWLHLRGRGVQWKGRQVVDDREGKR